jgi:apolipoprotein N-acyltransferase
VPWELLGCSQYRVLPLIQVADITGVYGLSFLLVFANCCLYLAFQEMPSAGSALRRLAPGLALAAVVLLYGFVQLSRYPAEAEANPHGTTIGIVQCSFTQDQRWRGDTQAEQLARYLVYTDEACRKGARLIIWPEAALQSYLQEQIPSEIIALLARYEATLVLGGPRYTGGPDAYTFYNSVFLLTNSGIAQVHDKVHLLPFGEYFPLNWIDVLRTTYAGPRQYSHGDQYTVLRTPAGMLGTPVCFEIAFPEIARGFVKKGADVLVTVSNDAWFGRSSAHYQHFSMAVLRAVELRRPVLRSANTGISGHIDRAGRVLRRLEPFQDGLILTSAAPGKGETSYCRYGDVFAGLCLVALLCCLAVSMRRHP